MSDPFTVIFDCENAETENIVMNIRVAAILFKIFISIIISIVNACLKLEFSLDPDP